MIRLIAISLCLLVTARAAEILPPTNVVDLRIEICATVAGTKPFTYQWYRGTPTNLLAVKIPAPEGVQESLILTSWVAGWYVRVTTNSAGSCTSLPLQVSTTRTTSAPNLQIVIKQP